MELSEKDILELIGTLFPSSRSLLGVGDDAAIVDFDGPVVISSDLLIEEVDFTRNTPLASVARKSLAVNLSDLAAMGARPHSFLLSLGIPSRTHGELERFIRALADAARDMDIELIGGDLSAAEQLTISLTVLGTLDRGSLALRRAGGRPGDDCYLSRQPGMSFLGWKLLERGWLAKESGEVLPPVGISVSEKILGAARVAINAHLKPEPEIDLGLRLSKTGTVSACIDVSDGLALDLSRLCEASGCGAVIEWGRIPRTAELELLCDHLNLNADEVIFEGGEDYGLLFTSRDSIKELSRHLGRQWQPIGRLEETPGLWLDKGGTRDKLEVRGFDHFRPR